MTSQSALPPVERRTLFHVMEQALALRPDALAQTDAEASYTYAQVNERSLRLGAGLLGLGVQRAKPFAFMLDNHLDLVHLWFGSSLTGSIEVPINTAYKGSFLAHVLNDSRCEVLVIEGHYLPRLADIVQDVPHLRTVVVRGEVDPGLALPWQIMSFEQLGDHEPAAPVSVDPGDLMSVMYTSGTTGVSKGALLSHAHTYTHASREGLSGTQEGDRILAVLPLFHLGAQSFGILQPLIHGASTYVSSRFSVSGFWPLVQEQQINGTLMLGAMSELLLQSDPHPAEQDNPLRYAYLAPLPSDIHRFQERFQVDLIPVYGSTESGCPITTAGEEVVPGEAGRSRGNYDLMLIDEDGGEITDGRPGELLVRPHEPHTIFAGYLNLEEQTTHSFVGDWLRTGDVLRRDEQGRYFFADRVKDSMRRRGENISSFEVESAINAHPDVLESAVLAVPSELNEDEVKAIVALRPGKQMAPEDLIHYLVAKLPYFMVPRFVSFIDEIPKTPTMKIDKKKLKIDSEEPAWDREAAGIVVNRHS